MGFFREVIGLGSFFFFGIFLDVKEFFVYIRKIIFIVCYCLLYYFLIFVRFSYIFFKKSSRKVRVNNENEGDIEGFFEGNKIIFG